MFFSFDSFDCSGHREFMDLMDGGNRGLLSADEQKRLGRIRQEVQKRLVSLPVEEVFT